MLVFACLLFILSVINFDGVIMAKKGKEEKTGEWPIMLLGLIFFITGIVPLAYAVM